MIVRMTHLSELGFCGRGARAWFQSHGLDFRSFLKDGVDSEVLRATGDARALAVVKHAERKRG